MSIRGAALFVVTIAFTAAGCASTDVGSDSPHQRVLEAVLKHVAARRVEVLVLEPTLDSAVKRAAVQRCMGMGNRFRP